MVTVDNIHTKQVWLLSVHTNFVTSKTKLQHVSAVESGLKQATAKYSSWKIHSRYSYTTGRDIVFTMYKSILFCYFNIYKIEVRKCLKSERK